MPEFDSSLEYRDVPGFTGYMVGNDGSVWGRWSSHGCRGRWRKMSPYTCHRQHLAVRLRVGTSRWKGMYVHRLVAMAFIGPIPAEMECCHNDGNPANNTPSNLRFDTRKGNAQDQRKHGTTVHGERNGRAILTEEDIRAIRAEYAKGVSQKRLARSYGVKVGAIGRVVRGETWTHII